MFRVLCLILHQVEVVSKNCGDLAVKVFRKRIFHFYQAFNFLRKSVKLENWVEEPNRTSLQNRATPRILSYRVAILKFLLHG